LGEKYKRKVRRKGELRKSDKRGKRKRNRREGEREYYIAKAAREVIMNQNRFFRNV